MKGQTLDRRVTRFKSSGALTSNAEKVSTFASEHARSALSDVSDASLLFHWATDPNMLEKIRTAQQDILACSYLHFKQPTRFGQ